MSTNKITTKSYFIKRLRDCGYAVDKIDIEFSENDSRRWMVLLDNNCSSVLITNHKDGTFSFYDGSHFLRENMRIFTDSIEIVVEHLNYNGITNKHGNYAGR